MSSKEPYQYGETLNITILGAQVFSCGERGLFINIPGDDAGVRLPCGPDGLPIPALRIERISPPGGPVEPGDLWRDVEGGVWLAYLHRIRGTDEVWLTRGNGHDDAGSVRAVSGDFGPLTLLFREALVSQPVAAEQAAPDGGNDDDATVPPAEPLAVASQQLRESTDGDSFAAAFGGFMSALGQAAEHEQGFHDDCDPERCADAEARVAELLGENGDTPAVPE